MAINTAVADGEGRAVVQKPRLLTRLLSLRETMVLAGITEREKEVRNDITLGVLPATNIRFDNARLYFEWPYVLAFAAVYGNKLLHSSEFRRVMWEAAGWPNTLREYAAFLELPDCWGPKWGCSNATVHIDSYVEINLYKACKDVTPRVCTYAKGLDRVEEKDEVLGGAAVFRDTRVSVLHIGKMADRGVDVREITEDYNLTEGDVEFAKLYYLARPPVGRPCGGANKHVESDPLK